MTSLRKSVVNLHKWLGLAVGIVWAIQGLTGALLVFHREAQRAVAAPLAQGALASLDVIAEQANAAAGHTVERIRVLDERGDLLGADYTDHHGMAQLLRIEAATGRVFETIERMPMTPGDGTVWRWIYTLHHAFLAGERGEVLVGLSGVLLISTAALGLWIGWPPARAWRAAFRTRQWRTTSQKLYGWHRALGLCTGLLLVIIPLSGVYMVFEPQIRPGLAAISSTYHPKYKPAPVASLPPIQVSPERAWQIAHAEFPAAKFESLALPTRSSPAYIARLTQSREARVWAGVTYVAIDPTTGAVLDRYDAVNASLGNRIGDAAFPIHNGEILALPGRVLVALLGLSLPAFAFTGFWSWALKSQKKRPLKISAAADRGTSSSARAEGS